MKLIFALLFVAGSLIANGQQKNNTDNTKSRSAAETKEIITKLNAGMEAAFNNNDMEKVAAFYTDDAHISAAGYQVSGRAQIDKYWQNLKDAGRGWKLEITEVGGQGEFIYQLGKSDLKYIDFQKAEQRSITNFVLLWKLQADGSYKIFRDYLTKNGFQYAISMWASLVKPNYRFQSTLQETGSKAGRSNNGHLKGKLNGAGAATIQVNQ